MKEKLISEKKLQQKTIFSFLIFVVAFALGIAAFIRIKNSSTDAGAGIPKTLRTGLNTNEKIFGSISGAGKLARTYSKESAAKKVRVNGDLGMSKNFDAANWKLSIILNNKDTLMVTLDEIKKLPKTEVVFDFKCIEGWSQRTWWGGVKFSDFVHYYHLEGETGLKYVGMVTPDKGYYVGIDMPSVMHPQTLLCYEMNGAPLPLNQGYPLRLIIPVKYGIKHLKRIGTIFFSNERPADYWAEQGYDYYSGH